MASNKVTLSTGFLDSRYVNITGDTMTGDLTTTVICTPTINGGILDNDDITIQGTTHATRTTSYVILQPNGGNVGIGTTTPATKLEISEGTLSFPQEASGVSRQVIRFLGSSNMGFHQRNDADIQHRLFLESWDGSTIFMVDNANIFFSKLSYTPAYEGTIRGKADNGWGNIGKYYRPTNTGNWRLEKLADGDEFQIWGWNNVIINTGNVGIGQTAPTACLHLKAGTATASTAPLKFTSGTLLTTPETGAVEFLTDKYYATITTGTARKEFAFAENTIRLLSTTNVSFAADGDTTLYTIPTGKRCVLDRAIIVAAGDAGATTTVSIGQDTAETDFVPANTLSNLDAQYDAVILQPIPNTTPPKIKSYAAGTVIQAQVANQSGVAGNTIYLFGILY